jgi:hypothetical protein
MSNVRRPHAWRFLLNPPSAHDPEEAGSYALRPLVTDDADAPAPNLIFREVPFETIAQAEAHREDRKLDPRFWEVVRVDRNLPPKEWTAVRFADAGTIQDFFFLQNPLDSTPLRNGFRETLRFATADDAQLYAQRNIGTRGTRPAWVVIRFVRHPSPVEPATPNPLQAWTIRRVWDGALVFDGLGPCYITDPSSTARIIERLTQEDRDASFRVISYPTAWIIVTRATNIAHPGASFPTFLAAHDFASSYPPADGGPVAVIPFSSTLSGGALAYDITQAQERLRRGTPNPRFPQEPNDTPVMVAATTNLLAPPHRWTFVHRESGEVHPEMSLDREGVTAERGHRLGDDWELITETETVPEGSPTFVARQPLAPENILGPFPSRQAVEAYAAMRGGTWECAENTPLIWIFRRLNLGAAARTALEAASAPANQRLYVALHTEAPGLGNLQSTHEAGVTHNLSGESRAPLPLGRWIFHDRRSISNGVPLDFLVRSMARITHASIALSDGVILGVEALNAPRHVMAGDTLRFPVGAVRLDDPRIEGRPIHRLLNQYLDAVHPRTTDHAVTETWGLRLQTGAGYIPEPGDDTISRASFYTREAARTFLAESVPQPGNWMIEPRILDLPPAPPPTPTPGSEAHLAQLVGNRWALRHPEGGILTSYGSTMPTTFPSREEAEAFVTSTRLVGWLPWTPPPQNGSPAADPSPQARDTGSPPLSFHDRRHRGFSDGLRGLHAREFDPVYLRGHDQGRAARAAQNPAPSIGDLTIDET